MNPVLTLSVAAAALGAGSGLPPILPVTPDVKGYPPKKVPMDDGRSALLCGRGLYRDTGRGWRRINPKSTNPKKATLRTMRRAESREQLFGHLAVVAKPVKPTA